MRRVEAVHRFDVPIDRGFAFITDTANWPRYWPGYVRLEQHARLVLVCVLTLAAAAVCLASAPNAAAIPGLVQRSGESPRPGESNLEPAKNLTAYCPSHHRVVGGGASIDDDGRGVRLTGIVPWKGGWPNHAGSITAYAEAPGLARFPWKLKVYALCAPISTFNNYSIKAAISYVPPSQTFDAVEAVCPNNTVAWGAGAHAYGAASGPNPPTGQIGLQLMRTDGALGIARATARESAAGYNDSWQLVSYAICADHRVNHYGLPGGTVQRPSGIHADGTATYAIGASDRCADGYYTHGLGGGAGITDSGPVWLRGIWPHNDLRGVSVLMTGPGSTAGVVAHQTCAR